MWNTVLFDLDGTLTESGEGITRCVQYALRKEFDIQVENLHDLDCFVGPPLKEQFKSYANLSDEEADRAIRAYRERYRTRGIYENRLYDGIVPLLDSLVREGMVLGLSSSATPKSGLSSIHSSRLRGMRLQYMSSYTGRVRMVSIMPIGLASHTPLTPRNCGRNSSMPSRKTRVWQKESSAEVLPSFSAVKSEEA